MFWIDIGSFSLLVSCLALVCLFEFVNGFHDTANAVAPVIYTKSLEPKKAVVLSGVMNFFWVVLWGIGVAMGIIHLLPLDVIAEQSTAFWVSVVLALLISAIIWNAGTWYLGIPASSSHSLIGSILWVSIAMMLLPIQSSFTIVPNWHKATEVIQSLLISPLIGFWLAALVMALSLKFISSREYFSRPGKFFHRHPKTWLRSMLIATSAWVSFAHGSNDGQKGVGLAMLILISLAPSMFAINPDIKTSEFRDDILYVRQTVEILSSEGGLSQEKMQTLDSTKKHIYEIQELLNTPSVHPLKIRMWVLELQKDFKALGSIGGSTLTQVHADGAVWTVDAQEFEKRTTNISSTIDYAPKWIIILISLSLWLGTMVGWRRIVVTIGEKIGKEKLNYAQATTSALITAITISLASKLALPVSTTHVLSSSVAGSMTSGKHAWIQGNTVKSILMAWILTLPVTIVLSGSIFTVLWYALG